MKRRSHTPSNRNLVIRCTQAERSIWRRLARRRSKTLADLVRDGLNTASKACGCLCGPGSPVCPHCNGTQPA